ncbi:MAG: hypothetical protein QOJ03_3153 [Frankiaceae bacterium]|nr:hypothetical protein [Frankiaceae bacterium]
MTRTAPAAARWLLIAVLALLGAWMLAPAAVPIYDGISLPDEPYRYVDPPADAKTTKAPTVASGTVSVRNGVSGAQFANSAEQGPQISLYLPAGALQVPPGAATLRVTARPLAPGSPSPADGTIVTNVYRVEIVAGSTPVRVIGTGRQEPTMQMRAPTAPAAGQTGPVFERRTATGWARQHTIRVGNDIFQSSAPMAGDYALVQLEQQASTIKGGGSGGGGGINGGLLGGGIALLVLSVAILAIRLRRTSGAVG